ncbi:MAG: hypothetical protein IKF11_04215 [Methanobrevibacter sp.]|nr:hypothetical protein [Methanobrevibacter sp.]
MNESPRSVKDLILQNEALAEDNDTLYKTNEELILEIRRLKQDLDEVKIHEEMLVKENKFLDKQNRALKLRCSKYCLQISDLEAEIKDMKFTHKMLNSEEAGRAFAQELLGKPMTKADLEEEQFIADGEAEYERSWNVADGDDF